jgi:hypothetical protein
MDFAILTEHFVLVVILACLVIGYIIKHATFMKWLPNDDIPVILAVVGAVANLFVSGFSLESVVYGAVMGLASTGMHQAFQKWIDNTKPVE